MPYIDQQTRDQMAKYPEYNAPKTPGELNYALTMTLLKYIEDNYHHVGYTQLNEMMGVLESVKQEFYRRKVVPYEDKKIAENGDVY